MFLKNVKKYLYICKILIVSILQYVHEEYKSLISLYVNIISIVLYTITKKKY